MANDPTLRPVADHPTRQQLDELDALLQRMLALPVSPAEESTPPARDPIRSTSEPMNEQAGEPAPVPSVAPDPDPAPTPAESEVAAPETQEFAAASLDGFRDFEADTPASEHPKVPELVASGNQDIEVAPPDDDPALPIWTLPLVWSNLVFDCFLVPFGPMGRWLRSSTGRNLLGLFGLGLLAAALTWVTLDVMQVLSALRVNRSGLDPEASTR